ncbi:MAG: type 4a pilus biogenesis protein PilO [Sulfurimonas sp.]|uniref:type 4a pilus biogenesis protein PilO n=1 Tax=Sulfurimonas sp. TaxID=2022749 RepID=UPI0026264FB5|nr:type 4a pilus biogenesis protein PilO [Sulfurimonas sp.]MDD2652356.1 type 4a pilus biogenesis protein PilO [Sulfurimonas sp.]MDD3451168.1 type 4a pilus biogenesis protein PilO [Sulfurimonas sp.]
MNFKLMIEEFLQKIDTFFKEKSQKDKYMVYIMILAIFSAVAYPFYESSENEFKAVKQKVADVAAKIDADKIYLKVNTEAVVAKLEQDIKGLENELVVQKDQNKYIKERIEEISSLIYNEKAWGEYLNSVSVHAKNHNIKILNFVNTYSLNNAASFGHVLDISLDVTGNYVDTVKFINSLEQSNLVVDVHDLDIKAQERLNSKIVISVWGITY